MWVRSPLCTELEPACSEAPDQNEEESLDQIKMGHNSKLKKNHKTSVSVMCMHPSVQSPSQNENVAQDPNEENTNEEDQSEQGVMWVRSPLCTEL